MDKLRKNLSGEYRACRRWLAYDILQNTGWLGRLRCFADYSAAEAWCKAKSGKEGIFRIRVLAEVLAGLNGVRQTEYTAAERETLCDLVNCRPIFSYKKSVQAELGMLRQRYFPVLWRSVLEPLSVIQTYLIMSRRGNGAGKGRVRILNTYPSFVCAMVNLKKATWVQLPDEELLLAGCFREKVDVKAGELAPADGVVVLYRSGAYVSGEGKDCEREIQQVRDPTEAFVIQMPYFARYDRPNGRIIFFDGYLRRVEPGIDSLRLDLEYFDFDWRDIFADL
jgi:hypothetical protein